MRTKYRSTRRGGRHVPGQKARGCFQERVKKVGPEHFAIIPVDCGKPEAQTRVADFYGNVLLEPFSFPISRAGLDYACCLIRETLREHQIADCVCAIETTGRYHRPVKQTFEKQNWETREVHPFTSSLIRRSADLGTKTDLIDLAAIHRAAVDGLAMRPEVLDAGSWSWRLVARHRRDLVEKAATLKIQLKETFDAYLPGYTRLWKSDHFWDSPVAATIATTFATAEAMREASVEQFQHAARQAASLIQRTTIDRIKAWTHEAAPADQGAGLYYQRACSLWKDLRAKQQEISHFNLDLADFLCRSPGVLLLAFPGIQVVSASDYAAELGPITNYATSKSIAGRAGIYPSRYQSCQSDHSDGPLVAKRNRRLRAALMRLARNLKRSNHYFMAKAARYAQRHDDHDPKIVIAVSFSRLSYYLLAGGSLLVHPAITNGERILQKLLEFYHQHQADDNRVTAALDQAIQRLSARTLKAQRDTLHSQQTTLVLKRRTKGVRRMSQILPEVLLRIDQRLQEEPPESQTDTQANINQAKHEDVTHGC